MFFFVVILLFCTLWIQKDEDFNEEGTSRVSHRTSPQQNSIRYQKVVDQDDEKEQIMKQQDTPQNQQDVQLQAA